MKMATRKKSQIYRFSSRFGKDKKILLFSCAFSPMLPRSVLTVRVCKELLQNLGTRANLMSYDY